MEDFLKNCLEMEERLHYVFEDKSLLVLACVHRSFWNENQDRVKQHNERLEFLGDSVLGILVAEYLYRQLPTTSEGLLSDLRSRVVALPTCAYFVHKLDLEGFLLLGKGEMRNIGKGRESILADFLEAIIGAIYLDGGYQKAKDFFFRHFLEDVQHILEKPAANWKAELQDYAQKKYQMTPSYMVLEESGPSHKKKFRIAVCIQEQQVGIGEGSSKKEAQQLAAKDALLHLKVIP